MPKTTFRSVTVDELIEALTEAREEHGGKTLVTFASDYGDYTHTQQVHSLGAEVNLRAIEPNAYSDSGFALMSEDEDDEDDHQMVLVLE